MKNIFFDVTKLETTSLFKLKTFKEHVIKRILPSTRHTYPKYTKFVLIENLSSDTNKY